MAFFYLHIMAHSSIIITAAGIGRRMNSSLPKQFIIVGDKPILMHTLDKFYHFNPKAQLILTLPKEWMSYWMDLMEEYDFKIPHRIVEGGDERYHSIKNALEVCTGKIIAVHDGVRPFVSEDTLKICFQTALEEGSAIPTIGVKESMRKKELGENFTVNSANYFIVQTPQCFKASILRKAYEASFSYENYDEATLVEEIGHAVTLVQGNEENIKITTQLDLKFAEMYLKGKR